jgi:hypothetical protein
MIDEGRRMARYQRVVACRRADPPVLGLLRVAGVAEDAGESGGVLGVHIVQEGDEQLVNGGKAQGYL